MEDGLVIQVQQFFHLQGAGQCIQVFPHLVVAVGGSKLVGQALQQQAGGAIVATGQPQGGRQLFGLLEIALQTFCQGVAAERDDALVLAALVRGDGDHHGAFADQCLNVAMAPVLAVAVAGQCAQLTVVAAFGQ